MTYTLNHDFPYFHLAYFDFSVQNVGKIEYIKMIGKWSYNCKENIISN